MQPPLPDSIIFVVNPQAGRSRPLRTLRSICEDACAAYGYTAQLINTQSAYEASLAARAAHDAGAAAIFGCGGDGTLSAILQGLPVGSPTALGVVPLGTANVWAYETSIPKAPLLAIASQLAALDGASGATMSVDTGAVWWQAADGSPQKQRFLLMASWGLDAAAVAGIVQSDRQRRVKRIVGEPAYFLSALRESVGRKAWPLTLRLDGGAPFDVDAGMLTVGNTRMVGTWLEVNPNAVATDGLLDVMLVEGAPWRAIAMAPLARHGWLPQGPGVRNLRCRRIEIAPRETRPPMQIDGDPGPQSSYAVDIEPQALRALCPMPSAEVLSG